MLKLQFILPKTELTFGPKRVSLSGFGCTPNVFVSFYFFSEIKKVRYVFQGYS